MGRVSCTPNRKTRFSGLYGDPFTYWDFAYTGSAASLVVPPGITTLTVNLEGAQGGPNGVDFDGGAPGGRTICDVAVIPGETVQVNVGQKPVASQSTAIFGGGGLSGFTPGGGDGGGGGGATDVRRTPFAVGNRLAVAGGGGGMGGNDNKPNSGGTGGGTTGGTGSVSDFGAFNGGSGGQQAAGGTGLATGTLGQGAAAGTTLRSGGGGGGGYWGGGSGFTGSAGQSGGGGGGGSGLTTGLNSQVTNGSRSGHGRASVKGAPSTFVAVTLSDVILGLLPLGYWKLNETSGSAIDYSGNGRSSGNQSGITLQGTSGGGDAFMHNDAASSYMAQIADNAAWSIGASGKTFFFLAKPDSMAANNAFLSKMSSTSGNYEYSIHMSGTGSLVMALFNPTGSAYQLADAPGQVSTGAWFGAAVTVAGTSTTSVVKMFKNNGTQIIPAPTYSGSNTVTDGTAAMMIGNRADALASSAMRGAMGHVAVFDGVLTDGQIGSIMSAASAAGFF